jgi:hypothetical protein
MDGDPDREERQVFIGTVFGLSPSGKYYLPFACSNVDPCPRCGGRGYNFKKHQTRLRTKKWRRKMDRVRRLFQVRGYIGHPERIDNTAIGRNYRRLQKLTETIHCEYCGGCGSHEAHLDELFNEKLEEEADAHGYFVTSGEGDPCDILVGECRDKEKFEDLSEGLTDEHYAKLDREDLVKLLEDAGIQCYDTETDAVLREALKVNVEDGTIGPEIVWEVVNANAT